MKQTPLTNELDELRRRLEEAEETLRAIRDGEVDALVMRGAGADEVFRVGGGTESYRVFMEAIDTGAAAVDGEGRVLYANNALCALLGQSLAELQGRVLAQAFDPASALAIEKVIAGAAVEKSSTEIRIAGTNGETVLLVAATPLSVGLVSGRAVTFTDITERVRAAAAEESERAARAILASANEAVVVCDVEGIITHANAAARNIFETDLVGRSFEEALPLVLPEITGLVQGADLVRMAIEGTAIQGAEATAPQARVVRDFLVSAAPLRLTGDLISGCVVTMADLSQRKAAEKQQMLLMAELDHRVKNTLTLVLAISKRTLSGEDTLESFQAAFTGRIHALAATHTLLADKAWKDLSVSDVVLAELAPYVEYDAGRVSIEGANFSVQPRAAIALGMIFHELATNAAKYGSLSNEKGRITVRLNPVTDDAALVEWAESDGPAVNAPTRSGFGRTVIARSLQYSQNGAAEITFDRRGVSCKIHVPREDVIAA